VDFVGKGFQTHGSASSMRRGEGQGGPPACISGGKGIGFAGCFGQWGQRRQKQPVAGGCWIIRGKVPSTGGDDQGGPSRKRDGKPFPKKIGAHGQ